MNKKISKKLYTVTHMDWNWAFKYYKKRAKIYIEYYISKLIGQKYWETDINGLIIKFSFTHPYHHHFAKNLYKGVHETKILPIWKKLCEDKGGIILDLGGYNGVFGLIAATANPKAEIFIFEPDPVNIDHIKKNIEINSLKNIKIVPLAITNKSGQTHFKIHDGGTSGAIDDKGDYSITSISVDDWASQNHKTPSLIKFDIEGAEYKGLLGAQQVLCDSKDLYILLELHRDFLKRYGDKEEDVWELLKSLSYKAIWLTETTFSQHYLISR